MFRHIESPFPGSSWGRFEKIVTWAEFSETATKSALPDATYVLDSSFLGRNDIPASVWDALLSRKILLTPGIWAELQAGNNIPIVHRAIKDEFVFAFEHGHSAISFLDVSAWSDVIRAIGPMLRLTSSLPQAHGTSVKRNLRQNAWPTTNT